MGDKAIYLIRWKLCWTPQSNIDDSDEAHASSETQNGKRRCSKQVKETAEVRMVKREQMMVAVDLEVSEDDNSDPDSISDGELEELKDSVASTSLESSQSTDNSGCEKDRYCRRTIAQTKSYPLQRALRNGS
jgi:hypothetical protein